MKNGIFITIAAITLLFVMVSCNKESERPLDVAEQNGYTEQVFGDTIVLGEKLNNPYAISNMQAAYDSLRKTKAISTGEVELLEPNWLYV